MFELKFDVSAIEAKARQLGAAADQIPFAISLALNEAVRETKQVLVQSTWPSHVQQRNAAFIGKALAIEFATKYKLQVEIFDQIGRAHLKAHTFGGAITAKKGRFAIPPKGSVTRTGRGIRKNQRPAAIIAKTPKRALRITNRGIFVGTGGRLQLMYAFTTTTNQPADLLFADDFRTSMLAGLRTSLAAAVKRAMSTRRPR